MNVADLVRRQRDFFQSGATRPIEFREAQLQKLRHAIETHEDSLLKALKADLRKSDYQGYLTEVGLILSEVRYAIRRFPSWVRPRRSRNPMMLWPARGFSQPEPYGVAAIIGPWNYPFQLIISPLIGAIAAGNCAVLKPSEYAPSTAAAIERLVEAAFAPEYVAVIQGGQDVSEALLRERLDFIFFTGSTSVGKAVMSAAARHLTPVALELGGKSPCVVCADAPLEVAARRIAWGKFMNAGQTCVAPDFVLADHRIRPGLLDALKGAIREFYGDDPQKSPEYGRIVNRRHLDRLVGYLRNGIIECGGQHDASDLYLAPTILSGTLPDSPVMQEEIFGPILPVLEFTDLKDALQSLRARATPLAFYLFSQDRSTQEKVLAEVRSGGVCINDTVMHILGKDLPFGGLGESGLGAYHGQASFDCFSYRRSILQRSFSIDPKLRYPPQRFSLQMLKRTYRFLLGG